MDVYNLFLCGTGGQGIVLAGRIIANVAFKSGFNVRESEIHGMSQRGGTVTGHVRFGKVVYSPTIPLGQADSMLALEELEALRYCHYLKKNALIILNARRVLPVALPEEQYPKDVEERLKNKGYRVFKVQARWQRSLEAQKLKTPFFLACYPRLYLLKPSLGRR